jgi:hypothetical protein
VAQLSAEMLAYGNGETSDFLMTLYDFSFRQPF